MKIARTVPAVAAMFVSVIAYGGDQPNPLDRYRASSVTGVMLCKTALLLTQAQSITRSQPTEASDYRKCVREEKEELKAALSKALIVVKQTTAKEALKSYHVAVMSALAGIEPGIGELETTYDTRQQSLRQKMDEAWARFEVEQ